MVVLLLAIHSLIKMRAGGWLYVSEPVYGGIYNELIRIFNDERVVRAAAQHALDDALRNGQWQQAAERRFRTEVRFAGFDDFERRMMHPTFAERHVDEAMLAATRAMYAKLAADDGSARFAPEMHVRLLRRTA